MKKTKKIVKNHGNTENIVAFNEKHGFDITKTKKCWKYYYKKAKRNSALALRYTYKYIDYCYNDKKYNPKMTDEDKLKIKNELLSRFGELSKMHKYSYSIISSVAASFLVSFLIALLQIPDETNMSVLQQIYIYIKSLSDLLAKNGVITLIVLLPLFILSICLLLLIPFSILIITYLLLDMLYYSPYRNIVVPYERKVILDTLKSFDERYEYLD